MSKVIAVVQARLHSQRLPGKVLLDLAGKPVLQHVIERVQETGIPTIVATGPHEDNAPIVELCCDLGVLVTTGGRNVDENHVGQRFQNVIRAWGSTPDVLVRATADCPLVDPGIIRLLVDEIKSGGVYANARMRSGLPVGLGAEATSGWAFMDIDFFAATDFENEHVFEPFLQRAEWADGLRFPQPPAWMERPYRLTLDTEQDYEVLTRVFDAVGTRHGKSPSTRAVLEWLDDHPWVARLNQPQGRR